MCSTIRNKTHFQPTQCQSLWPSAFLCLRRPSLSHLPRWSSQGKGAHSTLTPPFWQSLARGQLHLDPAAFLPVPCVSIGKHTWNPAQNPMGRLRTWNLLFSTRLPPRARPCVSAGILRCENYFQNTCISWQGSACPIGLVLVILRIIAFSHRQKIWWVCTKALITIISGW